MFCDQETLIKRYFKHFRLKDTPEERKELEAHPERLEGFRDFLADGGVTVWRPER